MKYTADQSLDKAVEGLKAEQALSEDIERAQDNLLRAVAIEVENDCEEPGWFQRLSVWWKETFNFSGLKLAGSMGAAASIAFVMFIFAASPQTSFASMVAEFKKVSNMFYSATMTSAGEHLMDIKVYYRDSGQVRMESYSLGDKGQPTFVNIMDVSQGKGVMKLSNGNGEQTVPFTFQANDSTQSVQENPLYWRNLILDVDPEKAQPLGVQTFSGTELTGYLIEDSGIEARVWVDPKTELPVKINVSQTLGDGSVGFEMQADVSYNQRFDDSLFALE
ncbi:hypothetical protein [Kangiella marina]|uniref:DUF4179 domain-containing protein n=1 Tax=Kangiella marina TaxID=1079178 RepID=A0ABP8IMS5_9GAMM